MDGTLGQGILDWDLIASYVAKAPLELPADFEVMISGKDGSREDEFRQLVECHRQAELFMRKSYLTNRIIYKTVQNITI